MIKLDFIEWLNWSKRLFVLFCLVSSSFLVLGCQNNDAKLNKNISDVVIEEVSIRPKFPGETKEAYFEYIINSERFSEWQFEYPSKLLDIAKSFPPNKVETFFKNHFSKWYQFDQDAATKYIEKEGVDLPLKDLAIEIVVNDLKKHDLATAVSWAHEINDFGKKHSLLEELATN